MKKLVLTLTILLTAGFVFNQATAQSNTGIGIRGGVNFANFNDTDAETEGLTAFHAGLYTSFHIPNSPVSIQPEVLYTRKGAESEGLADNAVVKAKLDYIQVPVLARFDFITNGNITPHVYFGPYIGFNTTADLKITQGEFSANIDIKDKVNVKTTDFGVMVGGGLDFGRLDVGVRYGAGLTEVFEGDNSSKNAVISITAGVEI